MNKSETSKTTEKKLIELIQDFDTAILVTKSSMGGFDARPMAIAEATDEGDLWFITDRKSGKVAEIELNQEVLITLQAANKFVTLNGNCRVVDDRAKVEKLWSDAWKVWFPEGKSDPAITLLHVEPSRGEYWDNSGADGLKYLLKAGKAYLQGDRVSKDESLNASVTL